METKKKLMDSAFKLFAYKGNGFSLSEVASEVGIQKASIYAHFASKEELLYAVIDQEINQYFFEINEHYRDLKTLFSMTLNYYDKSQAKLYFWKRLLLFPPKAFTQTLIAKIHVLSEERFQMVKDIICAYMKEGIIRNQDPETVAISYMAMIHGILSSIIIYQAENVTIHFEDIWENFWKGIC
ncbi:transcriptional regulator [Desulfosporosinus acidiphilus SJ4]|uniref:Transcriptional regulator n=1 Tax=Desulfosporosinus acidiphilus (strain DSM 22704 / JCM 16185 / SJ4) TaxID=646529 RepID=I4D0R9_DESAJ|nr:TetR/AcrR family transcriptional regulator [Desulfosporosinus acidiphilus]AFM39393.1 transcriptional regulator [Desulfosporosinus acidiphilus SJ4]